MISIVIPIFNQHAMTAECINAIREHTQGFELIIVDNGSEPVFKPPFMGFAETTLIRNEENKGFPVAVNQGIRVAKGDVIILLNNDVFVTPRWADRLASLLDEFSIVGPMANYCSGLQGITIGCYENIDELNKQAEIMAEEHEGMVEEVNYVIGFCMVFKKSLFDELGPFDESFWPCSGEEVDFCLKARKAGYKVGIVHDVYVHHEGSQTFGDLVKAGQIDYMKVCTRNEKYLAEKWGANFWDKQKIEREENGSDFNDVDARDC